MSLPLTQRLFLGPAPGVWVDQNVNAKNLWSEGWNVRLENLNSERTMEKNHPPETFCHDCRQEKKSKTKQWNNGSTYTKI